MDAKEIRMRKTGKHKATLVVGAFMIGYGFKVADLTAILAFELIGFSLCALAVVGLRKAGWFRYIRGK